MVPNFSSYLISINLRDYIGDYFSTYFWDRILNTALLSYSFNQPMLAEHIVQKHFAGMGGLEIEQGMVLAFMELTVFKSLGTEITSTI